MQQRQTETKCTRQRRNVKFLFILESQSGLIILGILVHEQGVVWAHYLHNILLSL